MATKKIYDTPIWIPANQMPTATSAVSTWCGSKHTNGRYAFYIVSGLFYKYDTWKDMYMKLAPPNITPLIRASMRYTQQHGYNGNVLAATGTTLTIPGLNGNILVGQTLEIVSGTGAGQSRVLNSLASNTTIETGMVTTATANLLTDTTKRWEINQHIGCQVRVVYGTGAYQVRRVLYNNENTLYFYDANYQQLEVWNNTAFSAVAPYAAPVATAGLQANYVIEQSTFNVTTWITTPDDTSSFRVLSGGVFLLSSVAATPFSSFQYYCELSDTWTTKTALGGNLLAALGTDFSIDLIEKGTSYLTSTATSGGARTLTDSANVLTVDRYENYRLVITGGTGRGQSGRIVANDATMFEIEKPWITNPDATSTYEVHADYDKIWLGGNAAASLYQYSIEKDQWTIAAQVDTGQASAISITYSGQEPFTMSTGVRSTSGITVLNATPTAAGTGYAVGDIFNITTGGTVGKGRVETITAGGVVASVSLYSCGINYTTGAGKATTNVTGSGTGLTVDITTIGTVGRITTVTNTNLYKGDSITIAGCSEAAWNTTYSILAIDSLTTFDIIITATANAAATTSQSTTVLVDASKNWGVNSLTGQLLKLDVLGPSPTTQLRRITSNTANTITVATIVAAANGTSRYSVIRPYSFGRDRMYDAASESGEGQPTGGSTTTLIDSTKTWFPNQWANFRMMITAGTGVGSEFAITSNTATTLTYATQSFTPDATTRYTIMGAFGAASSGTTTTIVDTTKNWVVNQWAGKKVVITAGTGQRVEATIASNTATTLTTSAITAPDTTTNYTILSIPNRGTGTDLMWISNCTDAAQKGNLLLIARGTATLGFDRYYINADKWDNATLIMPTSELFTAGCSYAYDGLDTVYATIALVTDFIRVIAINVATGQVNGGMQTQALQSTLHIGNIMYITSSPDTGQFLFLGVCTSRLMYKVLI